MSNTVFVMSFNTFEYDGERCHETDNTIIGGVYIKKEDAEKAIDSAIIKRLLKVYELEMALNACTYEGISKEKFDQIVALLGEDNIEFTHAGELFWIRYIDRDVILTEENVKEIAKLIEYYPYYIREMPLQ